MMAVALHFTWFVFVVVLLDFTVGLVVPAWIVAAMAVTYVVILWLDYDEIFKQLKGGYIWLRDKLERFNSALW